MYKPKPAKVISCIQARKMVRQGCLAYLAHVRDVKAEFSFINSIHIMSEFKEVFPINLLGMPPKRDIDFYIDL